MRSASSALHWPGEAVGQQDRPRGGARDGGEEAEAQVDHDRSRQQEHAAERSGSPARRPAPRMSGLPARSLPRASQAALPLWPSPNARRSPGPKSHSWSRNRRGSLTRSSPMPIFASSTSRVTSPERPGAPRSPRRCRSLSRSEHADVTHADIRRRGHTHILGHDHASLAHADVHLERHVASGQVGVAQVEHQLAHAELVLLAQVHCRRRAVARARRRRRRGRCRRRTTVPAANASATAGRTSQRTGLRNAPAITAAPATITSSATSQSGPAAAAKAAPKQARNPHR